MYTSIQRQRGHSSRTRKSKYFTSLQRNTSYVPRSKHVKTLYQAGIALAVATGIWLWRPSLVVPKPNLAKLQIHRRATPTSTVSVTPTLSNLSRDAREGRKPVLLLRETKFNGLGAQALRLVDALALAEYVSGDLQIVRARYWNYACAPYRTWDCYFHPDIHNLFLQPRPIVNGTTDRPPKLRECIELHAFNVSSLRPGTCAVISSPESHLHAAKILQRLQYPDTLIASRAIAQRIWHFNLRTLQRVNALCEQAGIENSVSKAKYVGVHIRRGDKITETSSPPLAKFIEAIEAVAHPELPVFVASDDGAVIRAFQSLTARRILFLPGALDRTGHLQRSLNDVPVREKEAIVHDLLAEIHALVQSEWFIGTFSSNLDRLVHVLRTQPPDTSISLDDRWAPSVAFYTFRQPYCESAGANKQYCTMSQLKQDFIN